MYRANSTKYDYYLRMNTNQCAKLTGILMYDTKKKECYKINMNNYLSCKYE